jgi:hypothetical protein
MEPFHLLKVASATAVVAVSLPNFTETSSPGFPQPPDLDRLAALEDHVIVEDGMQSELA